MSTSQAQWSSPIVNKRKSCKIYVKSSSDSSSNPSLVTPLSNWLITHKVECWHRITLSVSTKSFKSQVTGYHEVNSNPTPGDLVMSTVKEMLHPAYTMKESIGHKYIFFGKVK